MSRHHWCVLFVLLGGLACAHRGSEPGGGVDRGGKTLADYFPLAVGNSWIYQTDFQGQPQAELEVKLVKQEEGAFVDDRPVPAHYLIDAEGIRDGARRYLLKYPLRKGTRWMSVADVRTVEHYEIVADDKKVSLPAGEFSGCVVVKMEVRMDSNHTMRNYMTFAPGVGIAEVYIVLRDGQREIPQARLRLKSFSLQPSPQS